MPIHEKKYESGRGSGHVSCFGGLTRTQAISRGEKKWHSERKSVGAIKNRRGARLKKLLDGRTP